MKNFCSDFCLSLLLVCAPLSALAADQYRQQQGDVLDMPEAVTKTQRLPTNGMDKAMVERRYGTALRKDAAVGDPPISVWYYGDFKVYFEYNLVLHSVSEARKPTVYTRPE